MKALLVFAALCCAAHGEVSARRHPEKETRARSRVTISVGVENADIVGRHHRALQAAGDVALEDNAITAETKVVDERKRP